MIKSFTIGHPRQSDKDVFMADKLKNANFNTGFYQLPEISDFIIDKPKGLVLWSNRNKIKNKKEYALVFYEYDSFFDGKNGVYNILKYGSKNEIKKLYEEIKDFAFVVCPDYSVYGNFPNYKQIEALAKSREVGYVLTTFGIKVVTNYRATFEWSYELALSGIVKESVVAIGTLGALKERKTRELLRDSVNALVRFIKPRAIVVYGKAPKDVFFEALKTGIQIWQYDSVISKAFYGGKEEWE